MSSELVSNASFMIGGEQVEVPTLNGKTYREGAKVQLGKRLICGQELIINTTTETIDPVTKATRATTSRNVQYLSGKMVDQSGNEIDFGCGTEILCLKPPP